MLNYEIKDRSLTIAKGEGTNLETIMEECDKMAEAYSMELVIKYRNWDLLRHCSVIISNGCASWTKAW